MNITNYFVQTLGQIINTKIYILEYCHIFECNIKIIQSIPMLTNIQENKVNLYSSYNMGQE